MNMITALFNPLQDKHTNNVPKDAAQKELIVPILKAAKEPLSREEIRDLINVWYNRYYEKSSLTAALKALEKEGLVTWIKMGCKGDKHNIVMHYHLTRRDIQPNQFYTWDVETSKFVIKGAGV